MGAKNDFTKVENKENSDYRMWVAYRRTTGNRTKIFYSYNSMAPENALKKLENLAQRIISLGIAQKVIIYHNKGQRSGQILKEIL